MDTVNKYLINESDQNEYDLTFDERLDKDVAKLVKKFKGQLDPTDIDFGDARTLAYIDKKYAKKFEKALDKLGVDWS